MMSSPAYPTDLVYPEHFHREAAPSWIAATLAAVGQPLPDLAAPYRYLDLGCGSGLGLALLAAANPQAQFVGVDFNPHHIAQAETLAEMVPNLEFLQADFAALAENSQALGRCDFAVLHGVYSWVSPAQRAAIHRILGDRLAPCGVLYVHYTTHPGQSAFAGAQALIRRIGALTPGASEARVANALAVARALAEHGAGYFAEHPAVGRMLLGSGEAAAYLAHDLLPAHWSALHVGDVIEAMADLGCAYVGSATVLENIDALSIPASTQPVIAALGDVAARETARDLARNQALRRDLYRKGWAGVEPDAYRAQLDRLRFTALPGAADRGDLALSTRIGPVTIDAAAVDPLRRRLAQGPAPFADLAGTSHPAVAIRALQGLIAAGEVHVTLPGPPADRTAAHRLNAWLAARGGAQGWLAAPAIGSAIPIDAVGFAVAEALLRDPGLSGEPLQAAIAAPGPEIDARAVAGFAERVVPAWRELGVIPA